MSNINVTYFLSALDGRLKWNNVLCIDLNKTHSFDCLTFPLCRYFCAECHVLISILFNLNIMYFKCIVLQITFLMKLNTHVNQLQYKQKPRFWGCPAGFYNYNSQFSWVTKSHRNCAKFRMPLFIFHILLIHLNSVLCLMEFHSKIDSYSAQQKKKKRQCSK